MSDAAWPGKHGLQGRARYDVTAHHPDVPMETKLHAPSVRKEWVERRELVSVLAGADAKLVLVEAVALERDPTSPWYALAMTVLGFSLYLSGAPGAAEALSKAITHEAAVPLVRIMALSAASIVATEEGRLAQAKELASAARHVADDGDLGTLSAELPRLRSHRSGSRPGGAARGSSQRVQASRSGHVSKWPGLSPWPTLETLLRLASLLLDSATVPERPPFSTRPGRY